MEKAEMRENGKLADGVSFVQAAKSNNKKVVIKILNEHDNKTDVLLQKDSKGRTALYHLMQNDPEAVENLLTDCINIDNKTKDIIISFSSLSPSNEDKLFHNICDMKEDQSIRSGIDIIFKHPATKAYFYERWSQLKYAYFATPLITHFIYSICFTVYVLIVYKLLCPAKLGSFNNYLTYAPQASTPWSDGHDVHFGCFWLK